MAIGVSNEIQTWIGRSEFANRYPVGEAVKFTGESLNRSKTVRFEGN
jgi:hypothetical protein